MAVTVHAALAHGMGGELISVEASFSRGYAGIQFIGSATDTCRQGLERAKATLEACQIPLSQRKILINTIPADIKLSGSQFDLAFALALYCLMQEVTPRHEFLYAAELSLDGSLRSTKHIVSYALCARKHGFKGIIVAAEDLRNIEMLQTAEFATLGFEKFHDLCENWQHPDRYQKRPFLSAPHLQDKPHKIPDFSDMSLTPDQKQLAAVACAGGHHMMLYGPPGSGKSMFAERLTSLLPRLSNQHMIEALQIHSAHDTKLSQSLLAGYPPYRSPHSQCTPQAILGTAAHPGELSLAHGGVLFLDEFPEYRRDIIESLRSPLETRQVHVSRASEKVSWLCDILLVCAANNCPCGFLGSKRRVCKCPMNKLIAYKARISGPIKDRIDLHYNMPEWDKTHMDAWILQTPKKHETKNDLVERVALARLKSCERNSHVGGSLNSSLSMEQMIKVSGCRPEVLATLIKDTIPSYLSFRAALRALRVARTVADLAQKEAIDSQSIHVALSWQSHHASRMRGEHLLGISDLNEKD